jgi:hypothetical protein
MDPKIKLANDLVEISSRLEDLVTGALESPVTSLHFKEIRRLLNTFQRISKNAELSTKEDTANEIFRLNNNWKYIYYGGNLNQHSMLNSNLNLNEKRLFNAIIINNKLGDNPNFFDIMRVIQKMVIADEIKLDKVGLTIEKSFPTLITKLQQFCALELELRKNRT